MKQLSNRHFVAAAALALGGLAAAGSAHARSDLYFSVGIQPAQVYVQPAPVYVQPRPVYVQPNPVYVQPAPVYVHPGRRGWDDRDRDGIADRHERGNGHYAQRQAWRYGPQGDLDRDGVRNQDDRDRDGDGVRNRHDRFPNDPYRY